MFNFVVILFVSILGSALAAAVPDGRIVGGEPTTIDKYPYQVSVQYRGKHHCGGSILSSYLILTAAHCVDGLNDEYISVRVGSTYHNRDGQVLNLTKLVIPEEFNFDTLDYDVAVLRVNGTILLGSQVTLPLAQYPDHRAAIVTGWGSLYTGGPVPTQLYVVTVQTISFLSCFRVYRPRLTARMFCAADSGKDSCQGDSGGPVVMNGIQIGIVSWGFACADDYYPGVYADVFQLMGFINAAIKFLSN